MLEWQIMLSSCQTKHKYVLTMSTDVQCRLNCSPFLASSYMLRMGLVDVKSDTVNYNVHNTALR